jgi:hypothetical protein
MAANTTAVADYHVQAMMFADREHIEARGLGELCRGEDFRHALLAADRLAGLRIRREVAESVNPQFERVAHRLVDLTLAAL